jgi:hypothetical protein
VDAILAFRYPAWSNPTPKVGRMDDLSRYRDAFPLNTPDPNDWEICRDCLQPLGEHFERLRDRWIAERDYRNLHDAVSTAEIWWFYAGESIEDAARSPSPGWKWPDINFALVWLAVHVSAGFSDQFKTHLIEAFASLKRGVEENDRIWEEEREDNPAVPDTKSINMLAALPEIDLGEPDLQRPGIVWSGCLPSLGTREALRSLDLRIDREIVDLCKYLRQVEVILRARAEGRWIRKAEVKRARAVDELTEARDKYIYERAIANAAWDTIRIEVDKISESADWFPISTPQGIRSRAFAYAQRHQLPLPAPRQERSN